MTAGTGATLTAASPSILSSSSDTSGVFGTLLPSWFSLASAGEGSPDPFS